MLHNDAPPARRLPDGKPISALGFGCSSRWSQSSFPEAEALAILEAAVANGINHFDTAPSYALGEQRLGLFLQRHGADGLVLSTKVGTEAEDNRRSFDPDRMKDSFEASLARLGVPHVDILYLHGPEVCDLNAATFRFFDALKSAGKIRYSGVNSFDPAVVEACVARPVDAVMLQYSVADRRFDGSIERLSAAGKIVIAGTILAQGIFDLKTFVPRDRAALWYLLRAMKNDPLFAFRGYALARKLRRTGLGAHEAAVRFAVSNPAITSSLFGTRSKSHLIANALAALDLLTPQQIALFRGKDQEAVAV